MPNPLPRLERVQPCECDCGAPAEFRLIFANGEALYVCAAHAVMLTELEQKAS